MFNSPMKKAPSYNEIVSGSDLPMLTRRQSSIKSNRSSRDKSKMTRDGERDSTNGVPQGLPMTKEFSFGGQSKGQKPKFDMDIGHFLLDN